MQTNLLILIIYVQIFIAIDPVFGIVCYTCNSITLEACAMTPDASILPYEECASASQCAMSIVDSITYRGCSSSTPTVGATYKKICTSNLCNKGIYPPGRLKCYHCTGSECVNVPEFKANPCLKHDEEDECYTQVLSVDAVNRGCRSDANRTATDIPTEFCDINGCNNKPAFRKLIRGQCDSSTEIGCKMDLSTENPANCKITQYKACEVDVMLTENESCFLYHHLDRVIRGCTKNIPEEIEADIAHRHECNGTDFCNDACLERQKCTVCESTKYEACRDEASVIPQTVCGSAEISSCFITEYKDFSIERGCGPPPRDHPNINQVYECQGNISCNHKSLRRCYKCSTEVDANCANWERPGYNIEIEECEHPDAACIIASFYTPTSIIRRGCYNDLFNCDDSNEELISCHQCNGSFCNKGRYPPDRLRCYQCVGDEACAQIHMDPMPCTGPILDEHDACFEFNSADMGGMVRGCRSNGALYYHCILHESGRGCKICYDDGCNKSPAKIISNLWCYKCSRNDASCQTQQIGAVNLILCSNPPFGYSESCYITKHLDGTISRGCTLKQSVSSLILGDQIGYCSTNGCNFVGGINKA